MDEITKHYTSESVVFWFVSVGASGRGAGPGSSEVFSGGRGTSDMSDSWVWGAVLAL